MRRNSLKGEIMKNFLGSFTQSQSHSFAPKWTILLAVAFAALTTVGCGGGVDAPASAPIATSVAVESATPAVANPELKVTLPTAARPTKPLILCGVDDVCVRAWLQNVANLIEVGIVNGVADQTKAISVWTPMSPMSENVGDTAWKTNLANGNIKILKSGEMAPDINGVSRNIWRAIFFNPRTNGYCFTPVNAHDGSPYSGDSRTSVECFSSSPDYMIGVSDDTNKDKNGMIYKGGGVCYLTTVTRGSESISCPF
jgi:hypothetical protein